MTDAWYCAHDGRTIGPFPLRDMKTMFVEVPNWSELRVWRNGFSEWERAGDLEEFADLPDGPPARPARQGAQRRSAPEQTKARRWPMTKVLSGVALIGAIVIGGAFGMVITRSVPEPTTTSRDESPHDGQDRAQDRSQDQIELQGQTKLAERTEPQGQTGLEERIAKGLEGLGAALPKKVDDLTTMISARNDGSKVVFGYRLEVDGSRLNENVKAKVRELATKDICAEKQSREVLSLGGSFQLNYTDISGKPVTTVDIANRDCP